MARPSLVALVGAMLTTALLISATIPMAPESVSGVVFPTAFPFPMSGANAPSDLAPSGSNTVAPNAGPAPTHPRPPAHPRPADYRHGLLNSTVVEPCDCDWDSRRRKVRAAHRIYITPVFVRKGLSTVCFCGQGVCRIGEAWEMRACGREGWGWGTNGGEVA